MFEVLALDPGKSTGWACGSGRKVHESGALQLKGDAAHRAGELLLWIEGHLPSHAIAIEKPRGLRGQAAQLSVFSLLGVAFSLAYKHQLDIVTYLPQEVKAHTGYGRATKYDVKKWAKLEHKIETTSGDEADAVAVCSLCLWERTRWQARPGSTSATFTS